MYYAQVKRYLDIFPPENVKVILFDDFKVDTIEVMSQIYKFLEVDEELALKVHSKFNKAVVPRFPRLHAWLVQTRLKRQLVSMMPKTLKQKIKDAYLVTAEQMKLTDQDISFAWPFFADDVKKLSALLGKDLSKWEPHV
jgi:hypothetical protein